MPLVSLDGWSAITLIEGERNHDYGHDGSICHSSVVVYEQRGKQEIMDEEQQQVDGEVTPYDEYLCPVEPKAGVVYVTDVQA